MHDDEFDVTTALVRQLVDEQFPQWGDLPVRRVQSPGTDNAVFRLGDELSLRFPRIHWAVGQVALEHVWLPRLAPRVPLEVPQVVTVGEPGAGYPWQWSVHEWLAGASAIDAPPSSHAAMLELADTLAAFVRALHSIEPTADAPAAGRGVPLRERYANIVLDHPRWREALAAPDWHGLPVLVHGDLLPGNLLLREDRLVAVIDFAGFGSGDPACDHMSAWALLDPAARRRYRAATGVDDATWARARGHAIGQAMQFIPYYRESNPIGVQRAERSLRAALEDDD